MIACHVVKIIKAIYLQVSSRRSAATRDLPAFCFKLASTTCNLFCSTLAKITCQRFCTPQAGEIYWQRCKNNGVPSSLWSFGMTGAINKLFFKKKLASPCLGKTKK